MTGLDQFFSALFAKDPGRMLTLYLLVVLRIAPFVALAPFFGARLPTPLKVGLSFVFAAVLFPGLIFQSEKPLEFEGTILILMVKEVMVGGIFATALALPFYFAQSAGIIIDFARGSSAMQAFDPVLQTQASDIGLIYNYFMIVVFHAIGGPFLLFDVLLDSYRMLPAGGWISETWMAAHGAYTHFTLPLLGEVARLSLQLAAPSFLAILMTELFLGIVNRLAPQVQISFLGMALKSLAGLTLLVTSWWLLLQELQTQSIGWLRAFQNFLHKLS